ncbi:MAG: carbonic anhydrase [Candidatus Omnitrophota bacterium]
MNYQKKPVLRSEDIPSRYRGTPVGALLEYHNLGRAFLPYTQAQILIGMCMDNRKHLRIPDHFAYIIRSGGANLRYSEFKVSYAIAVGQVTAIALIAHNHCGMVNLVSRKEEFIRGLVERAGWAHKDAEDHFMNLAPLHELDNEMDFVLSEADRLTRKYPKILVASLYYQVEDNQLYCLSY